MSASKEKQFVFQNRTADGSAKLVELEPVIRYSERITRVERSIANEFKQVAMKVIRAGLRDRVHGSGRVTAILRLESAGLDFKLLQRIGKRHRQIQIVVRIVVIAAIKVICQTVRLAACDRDNCRRIIPAARIQGAIGAGSSNSRKKHQLGNLTAIERQLQHTRIVDDLPDPCIPRLDQCSIRLNLNLLGHPAYVEANVDHGIAVDLQHDSGLYVGAESRQARLETIRTNRKTCQRVGSGFIRDRVSGQARFRLRHGDFGAWQNCPGLILHCSRDLSRGLSPNARAREHSQQKAEYYRCFHACS